MEKNKMILADQAVGIDYKTPELVDLNNVEESL